MQQMFCTSYCEYSNMSTVLSPALSRLLRLFHARPADKLAKPLVSDNLLLQLHASYQSDVMIPVCYQTPIQESVFHLLFVSKQASCRCWLGASTTLLFLCMMWVKQQEHVLLLLYWQRVKNLIVYIGEDITDGMWRWRGAREEPDKIMCLHV